MIINMTTAEAETYSRDPFVVRFLFICGLFACFFICLLLELSQATLLKDK